MNELNLYCLNCKKEKYHYLLYKTKKPFLVCSKCLTIHISEPVKKVKK